jgi:hypothetical protein
MINDLIRSLTSHFLLILLKYKVSFFSFFTLSARLCISPFCKLRVFCNEVTMLQGVSSLLSILLTTKWGMIIYGDTFCLSFFILFENVIIFEFSSARLFPLIYWCSIPYFMITFESLSFSSVSVLTFPSSSSIRVGRYVVVIMWWFFE